MEDEQRQKLTFPAIIERRDEALVGWLTMEHEHLAVMEQDAAQLVVRDSETLGVAVDLKRHLRERKTEVQDRIKPYKQRLDEIKKQVLDVEKSLAGGYARVEEGVVAKMNAHLNEVERLRQEEEKRLREIAEKDREKRVARVNAELDKLLEKVDGLQEKKKVLEDMLHADDLAEPGYGLSSEKTATILARLEAIDQRIGLTESRVETRQADLSHLTTPVNVSVEPQEKVAGLSSTIKWKLKQILDVRAIARQVVEGKLPVGVLEIKGSLLEQIANQQVRGIKGAVPDIQGASFEMVRDTRVR